MMQLTRSQSLLIIDKEPGPTSFDVVREVKKLYPGFKVGHAGSLDPFASGVLVLLLGRATKLSGALLNADKSYLAKVKLGIATNTMDREGEVTSEKPVPELTREAVEKCLRSFEGTWMQVPPMFSAKKLKGVRLYDLAREKIHVRLEPVPVQVYRLELKKLESPYLEVELECSKGTYVRALADEIGKRLGTVAHLEELRRLSCGDFWLDTAVTLGTLKQAPVKYFNEGYQHFLKLLRTEGVNRKVPPQIQGVPFANPLH